MQSKSAAIHVCALRHIPEVIAASGARHLVSAIDADLAPETPAPLSADRHLRLDMHDILDAVPGALPPAEDHVHRLLNFAQSWDGDAPLLIHCFAGLSRSTAAAFITLCALNPDTPEARIALALRAASDTAVPNRRFVALADTIMRRQGRMLAAVENMGRNRIAAECVPFRVESHYGEAETSRVA